MAEDTTAITGESLIDGIADWLIGEALGDTALGPLFDGCCRRLYAAGVPLLRGHMAHRTLHPLFESETFTWRRDAGVAHESFPHGQSAATEAWQQSPLYFMLQSKTPILRRRLTSDEALLDFPILHEFRERGATDYLAYIVPFGPAQEDREQDGIVVSWTTDRESGFTDQDVRSLLRIQRRLAVAAKMTIEAQIARTVVTTYLGRTAGLKVLNGSIRRGDGERIRAVIWYSDLRGSTEMADRLPADKYMDVLNGYFECAAGGVLDNRGEVLAFIGDAVLAIFPLDGVAPAEGAANGTDRAQAAGRLALAAAEAAAARLAKLNKKRAKAGQAPLAYGLALHVGEVVFGNIGVPARLEFSVIGRTVNEVARLESLTKTLGRPLLVSRAFAELAGGGWESLGEQALPGVDRPIEVLAPKQAATTLSAAS